MIDAQGELLRIGKNSGKVSFIPARPSPHRPPGNPLAMPPRFSEMESLKCGFEFWDSFFCFGGWEVMGLGIPPDPLISVSVSVWDDYTMTGDDRR